MESITIPATEAPSAGLTLQALSDMAPGQPLTAEDLARIFDRNEKSIHRAAARGELPPPVKFMGRKVWTSGAILEHLGRRQAATLAAAARRDAKNLRLAP